MSEGVGEERVVAFFEQLAAVRAWLEDSLRIKLPESPAELMRQLRTGIVLCYLARAIEPRSIPRIQENEKQPYLMKDNVKFFIAACTEEFNVPAHKRFTMQDIENGRVVPVTDCLFTLAGIAVSKHNFKHRIADPSAFRGKVSIDGIPQDVLRAVKAQIVAVGFIGMRKATKGPSSSVIEKQLSLALGGRTSEKFLRFQRSIVRFQAICRGVIARRAFEKLVRDQAYRERVANEILQTEREFVSYLATCTRVFMDPLTQAADLGKPIFKKDEIAAVFFNIKHIHIFHVSLLDVLEERVGKGKWSMSKCIGDIFLKIMDFNGVYTAYVQNFNKSIETFEALKNTAKVKQFLITAKEYSKLELPALLIMPVQRIPRYHLLLLEYTKHTQSNHPDMANLKKAIEVVKKFADILNRKKREAESITRLLELDTTITNRHPTLWRSGCYIVKEGTFDRKKKHDDAFLVLMNDSLLYCTSAVITGKLKYKDTFELWLVDMIADEAAKDGVSFTFLKVGKPFLQLCAKTDYERDDFLRSFREAKEKYDVERGRSSQPWNAAGSPTSQPQPSPQLPHQPPKTADAVLKERRRQSLGPAEVIAMSSQEELQELRATLLKQIEGVKDAASKGQQEKELERIGASLAAQLAEVEAKLRQRSGGSNSPTPKPGSPLVARRPLPHAPSPSSAAAVTPLSSSGSEASPSSSPQLPPRNVGAAHSRASAFVAPTNVHSPSPSPPQARNNSPVRPTSLASPLRPKHVPPSQAPPPPPHPPSSRK